MMNSDVHSILLPFRDGRIPEMLGNFQLDDHNVEEWDDTTDPSLKYHGRKEIGKWVDANRNADIQFQRHEDVKKFVRGHENQRTEIIQGTAPDSNFQIVRTERQFNDSENGPDHNIARLSSTSTSYQMNSARGIRSTSKTTSNKTTTKSISVSSGKTDDFENLKIAFYPLDTSTQREKIQVSRSGTMGVRRPPTRKQPTSHQENEEETSMVTLNNFIPESTNPGRTVKEAKELSILDYKNISPKIRVGFPVEIQVELRTKFKEKEVNGSEEDDGGDSTPDTSNTHDKGLLPHNLPTPFSMLRQSRVFDSNEDKEVGRSSRRNVDDFEMPETGSFFNHRRKSYGFESFDSHSTHLPKDSFSTVSTSFLPFITSSKASLTELRRQDGNTFFPQDPDYISKRRAFIPSALSRSWDFMEKLESPQKLQKYQSQQTPESEHSHSPIIQSMTTKLSDLTLDMEESKPISPNEYTLDSLEVASSGISKNSSSWSELCRDHGKVVDEKDEDVENGAFSGKLNNWETEWEKTKRELDLLKDAISDSSGKGSLDEGHESKNSGNGSSQCSSNYYPFTSRGYFDDDKKRSLFNGMGILSGGVDSLGRYTHQDPDRGDPNPSKQTQVSQTWISSVDLEKPSRHAHDNELSTSISATSDPSKKNSKKVEFCKTEVHFTPEPGRFHIVESDENKPSTVHLFRRKKRKTSLEGGQPKDVTLVETEPDESIDVGESEKNPMFANRAMNLDESPPSQDIVHSIPSTNGKYEDGHPSKTSDANSANHLPPKSEDTLKTPILLNPSLLTSDFDELFVGSRNSKGGQHEVDKEEFGDMDYADDVLHSARTSSPVSNYEELKIQKYLKQLKPPPTSVSPLHFNNNNNNGINYAHNEYLTNDVRPDYNNDDENSLHFRYGSFVPLATRRSLIEMNNRNRMRRSNYTTNSHSSDKSTSTTTSNFSLPHSQLSREAAENPLKLRVMEATVAATRTKPRITSLELRYSLNGEHEETEEGTTQHQRLNERRNRFSHVPSPSPLLPADLRSMPPYRSGRHSYSASPTREITSFRHSKPPTPILPLQFSTFEKTGEALRKRFFSKNPQCLCNVTKRDGESKEFVNPESRSVTPDNESQVLKILKPGRPLTSVVRIGADETCEAWKGDDDDEAIDVETLLSSITNGKGIVRSLTFPKSSRSEPEWVSKARAKAKNREIHGTDWTLLGQRFSGNPESVPLWISELKIKNQGSSGEDDVSSFRKSSFVYPWPRDNGNKEGDLVLTQNENEMSREVDCISTTASPNPFPQHRKLNAPEENMTLKSFTLKSTSTINKSSLGDLNRDSESILINPNQIELSPTPGSSPADQKSKSRKTSTPPLKYSSSESNSPLRGNLSRRISKNEKIIMVKPTEITVEKVRNPKGSVMGGENGNTNRKPLQTSTSINQTLQRDTPTQLEDGKRHKAKAQVKPPKPPQRISSLVTTTNFNINVDKVKCTPVSGKMINTTNNPKDVESSNTSSVILHRHPTLKVSKLPMRTSPSLPGNKHSNLEEKDSLKYSKTKAPAEEKSLYKGKPLEDDGSTKKSEVGGTACTPRPSKSSRSPTTTAASPHQRKR